MKTFYSRPKKTTTRLFQDLADYHDRADKWGSAMGLLFDVVGVMSIKGLEIPAQWEYRESPFGPDVSESNEDFLISLPEEQLKRLGGFCYRLTRFLDRNGVSY